MDIPDVSKFVGCCKDFLHAEWASYKKTAEIEPCSICIYSVGGEHDIPAACIQSVGNGFKELERVLRETFHLSVDTSTPIISKDVMVWADGQITLYPPRKNQLKVENVNSVKETGVKSPPSVPGKKPKVPPTPEAAFMGGIEQIANYMLDHLKRMSESCLLLGNIRILYYILASAILVKSRVLSYKQVLKSPNTKSLASAIARCNESIEVITQHLLNYHSDIIRSSILHDAPSQDWTSIKFYEESEKISLSITMWAFYMQGIHNDLWCKTSMKVGETIFNNIFTDTLGLLVTRYLQIESSDTRLPQFRADIIAIFAIVASFLFALAPSPRFLFRGNIRNSIVFSAHRRMDLLLRVAALKCAPIETLAKVYSLGIYPSKHFYINSREPTDIVSCPSWLTFLNQDLFPANTRHLSSLPDNVAVYLTLNIAALRPFPNQALILRGLFMRNFLAAKTILRALQDMPGQVGKGETCDGALCIGCLCSPPLLPHTVYSAIVQILIESFRSPVILNEAIQAGIKDSGNWDSLDRKQVWNIQRPPWHHALVQAVGLYVSPAVAQVLQTVPAEPPAQPAHPSQLSVRLEHHLSAWTLQLINGVGNLAENMPLSIIQVSQTVNSVLPPTIKPVGGHVISQLVISSVYSIVNSRSSLDQLCLNGMITNGQWDMMIAVGERLCSLHDGHYDAALEQMTKSLLLPLSTNGEYNFESDEKLDMYTNEEAIEEVCQQMADVVMSSMQGKHAFGVVWEYLKRNMRWVASALEAPPLITPSPGTNDVKATRTKHPRMSFAAVPDIYNPLKFYDRVFFTKLNNEYLMNFQGDWESVLEGDLWIPKDMIRDLINDRPEMFDDATLTPSQSTAVRKLRILLKK